jgi:hypothetical protein
MYFAPNSFLDLITLADESAQKINTNPFDLLEVLFKSDNGFKKKDIHKILTHIKKGTITQKELDELLQKKKSLEDITENIRENKRLKMNMSFSYKKTAFK